MAVEAQQVLATSKLKSHQRLALESHRLQVFLRADARSGVGIASFPVETWSLMAPRITGRPRQPRWPDKP
jgi:hypothetical protein